MRLIVSHPHGNPNSSHVAKAFYEQGWLASFHSGVNSDDSLARFLSVLSPNNKERLLNRDYKFIPKLNRHSHVFWETASRLGKRISPAGLTSKVSWYDVLFCGHDQRVANTLDRLPDTVNGVYAYEDGAKKTFVVARERSAVRIYELPAGFYAGVAHELQRATEGFIDSRVEFKEEPAWKRKRKDEELNLSDIVVVPSSWARESLRFSPIGDKKPVLVIPYGTPADDLQVRGRKPNGPFTVLFAGRIGMRKGIQYLLNAWESLHLRNARLQLAGSLGIGAKHFARYSNLEYLGALPRVELIRRIQEADLLVLPSLAEGFGLVIGEAMALGVPVLASTNTGGPELINNGVEGWCVSPRDADALAERIEWGYHNRDKLYEMGRSARTRAEGWTWAHYRRTLIEQLSLHLASLAFGVTEG